MRVFAVLAWLIPLAAHSVDTSPIQVRNSLPVLEGAGLGTPKSARIEEPNTIRFNFNTNIESHANDSGSTRETLIIDGEVHSATLNIDWGFAPQWQANLGVRALRNTSGQFDGAIDAWHDFFNLDDGDRARQPDDQLLYFYSNTDGSARLAQPSSGLGDLQVGLSRQLVSRNKFSLAAHADASLSSGSARSAISSNKPDARLTLAASGQRANVGWHLNLGAVAIGDKRLFAIPTNASTWTTSLGAHWQTGTHWRWSAQLDGHGPIFNSAIAELSQNAWQLALAGEWQTSKATIQLYFTEDVVVNSSADFAFGVNLRFYRR